MAFLGDTMGNLLVKCAVSDFAIQWSLFVVAAALQTEKFYDLAGSSTFLFLAYQSLQWGETFFLRQKIQSGMVMIWALRLGMFLFVRVFKEGEDRHFSDIKKSVPMFFGAWSLQAITFGLIYVKLGLYLFLRVLKEGGDSRFDKVRSMPSRFFIYWTIQGIWVLMTLLPTLILNSKKEDKPLCTRDYLGWSLWLIGFLFETIADYQKSVFRNDPNNAGKFINSGLWSLSRHPNYFGEILLWSGLYISASTVFRGREFLSVISPVFVTLLLTKVSGIPLLEKSGMKRWGADPKYQQYIKNTAVLVPFLW